jgi:sugar-specific transcriptional regulator TrmB
MEEREGLKKKVRKDIEAFLKSLGSTTSEISIFMPLYRTKRYMTVKEIEERTKLSNKGIRTALKRLVEKELVIEKEKDKRKVYRAVSLKEVVEKWRSKMESMLDSLFRRP